MEKHPQNDRISQFLQDTYGAEPEHLWAQYPTYSVFRHPASRKWFAVFMEVPKDRLGLEGAQTASILNVKCGPIMTGALLSQKGFLPAYHMNKATWISILLDESVPDDTIFPLLEFSYDSTAPKRKNK